MQTEEKSYYIYQTNHKPWVSKEKEKVFDCWSCKTISGLKTHPRGLGIPEQQNLLGDHTCQHLVQTRRGMIDKAVFVFQRLELDQVKKPELLWSRSAILLFTEGELASCPYSSDMWEMGQANDQPSNSLVTRSQGATSGHPARPQCPASSVTRYSHLTESWPMNCVWAEKRGLVEGSQRWGWAAVE